MNTDCRVAEIQLKYKPKPFDETIFSSNDIYHFLMKRVYNEDAIGYKESFKVVLLNNSNKVVGYTTVSEGGLTSTIVDVRVVMQTALVCNATAIILTHNHPSGNVLPSTQDDDITRRIKSACDIMNIRLIDHVVVTPFDSYYSYCDKGRLQLLFVKSHKIFILTHCALTLFY